MGTVGEVRVSSSKDRAEMGSFPLCTVFRGLGQDGESLTRKAKDYSFLLPCSDFVSVRGAGEARLVETFGMSELSPCWVVEWNAASYR